MGSYGDESYTPRPSRPSGPFFKPTPKPVTPPPSTSAAPPKTKRASRVRPPVTTRVSRPKGKVNVLLALDTTSSMGEYRDNIREKAKYLLGEITQLLPQLAGNIEMAVVGIGDHCDGNLMIQPTAFSGDIATLKSHIESILDTDGGDFPEAFECSFKIMNTWDIEGTNTILILVTDSVPHGMESRDDNGCPDNVDWKTELGALKKKLKAFYVVSCSGYQRVKRLQGELVDDDKYLIELGGNFRRLTNIVHGIVADQMGEIDKYLGNLQQTRGSARAEEVKTLLKTQGSKTDNS